MEVISRKDAIAKGLNRFFTGKPCIHGHLIERRTDNRRCVQCMRDVANKVPKEKKKELFAKYYAKNTEAQRQRTKDYREKNPEKTKQASISYRINNKEKVQASQKRWRELNPNYKKEYRNKNPEKSRIHFRNRYAKKKAAEGRHTANDIKRIYLNQGGKCAACGIAVSKGGMNGYHVDHIQPIVKGGSNGPENLQILCAPCNLKKGPKCPIEWANMNGKLL
jgi:5-methylcytosine-specific restriction endonuclease McrA